MDPALQATRDYVRDAVAAASSIEDLIALVERDTSRLHAAASGFTEADLDRPLDADWTPRFCLAHIVARSMLRAREVLYVALSGELPPEEEAVLPGSREDLLKAHRQAMDSLYAHAREATDDFLAVEWAHPAVGAMNWKEWLVFIRIHIESHASQLEEMQRAV